MRSKTFNASTIKEFLLRRKIATMPELQTALGTRVNMTVIRKLEMSCLSQTPTIF